MLHRVYIVFGILSLFSVLCGAEVTSSRAKRAISRYDSVLSKAKRVYERSVEPARIQALRELEASIEEAKSNNDSQEAKAIEKAKDNIIDSSPNNSMTAVEFQRKLVGTAWTWTAGNQLLFTPQGFRLSYWRPDEIGAFRAVGENSAILKAPPGRSAKGGPWEFTVTPSFTHFLIVTDESTLRTGELMTK